jgi:hypothetical protein
VAYGAARRGAKRVQRERTIVLVDDALWAVQRLIKRAAEKCGATDPDHFLIPYTKKDHKHDPTRQAVGYREGMGHLLAICDTNFRRYDLRHHAISKALSDPRVSLAAARMQFGHVDDKMQKRYYHGNLETLKIVAARHSARNLYKPRKFGSGMRNISLTSDCVRGAIFCRCRRCGHETANRYLFLRSSDVLPRCCSHFVCWAGFCWLEYGGRQ